MEAVERAMQQVRQVGGEQEVQALGVRVETEQWVGVEAQEGVQETAQLEELLLEGALGKLTGEQEEEVLGARVSMRLRVALLTQDVVDSFTAELTVGEEIY